MCSLFIEERCNRGGGGGIRGCIKKGVEPSICSVRYGVLGGGGAMERIEKVY